MKSVPFFDYVIEDLGLNNKTPLVKEVINEKKFIMSFNL